MRQFTEVIFCGNGDYSVKQIERLKARLEEGTHLLSGLQQPGHPDSEQAAREEKQYYENGMNELADVVRDIATALGCESLIQDQIFCSKHGWSEKFTGKKDTCITCLADAMEKPERCPGKDYK
jgi:hypothetical protein